MAVCIPQDLLNDAGCLNNLMRFQLLVIQTRLLCQISQALDPMSTCDPQTLLDQAGCLSGLTPFQLAIVNTQILCNVSAALTGGGGLVVGNQFSGNGDPNGVQVGSVGDLFIQLDAGGRIWSKTSGTSTATGWE